MGTEAVALSVKGLTCGFELRGRLPWRRSYVPVVRDVDFGIPGGETLGLVGESGCGKTTLARSLLRLVEPRAGEVSVLGRPLTGLRPRELRQRRGEIQMVFQDPDRSLSPRRSVAATLDEALSLAPGGSRMERSELLEAVQLHPDVLNRFPNELSGGQRQRVSIARALAPRPVVLVADEPVSALDVSVQARILNLLLDLQERLGLTMLFISHDLGVVRRISHRVAVMYLGGIVEIGSADDVLGAPAHPYTRALLDAVPQPDPAQARRRLHLPGDVPDLRSVPPGCPFHTRCPEAMEECRRVVPRKTDVRRGKEAHVVRCLLHE